MAEFPSPSPLGDRQSGGRIRINDTSALVPDVLHHVSDSEELGRALHQRHQLSFCGAEGDVVLGPGPSLQEMGPDHQGTPTGGAPCDTTTGPIRIGVAGDLMFMALPVVPHDRAPVLDQVPAQAFEL